jgi:hypothetical protein
MLHNSKVNKYSDALYSILNALPDINSTEDPDDFMKCSRIKRYNEAVDLLLDVVGNGVNHKLCTGIGKSSTISLDIPDRSPSGNSQMLEIKVSIKVKE